MRKIEQMEKKIAVFIPCYNASRTIGATLESVEASVRHLGSPVPVYIYDDCSKDDSLTVARNHWSNSNELKIVKNSMNLGERLTTNNALKSFREKYDWVLIIHADDIVKQDWLSELYKLIGQADDKKYFTIWSSFDSLDDITGKVVEGDNTGNVSDRDRTYGEKKQYLIKLYGNWHISGAAINLSLFQELGGFDITMPQFGDTDFFVRGLMRGFRDVYLSRTLTFYRVIVNSVSSVSVRSNRDFKEVLYILDKFRDILDQRERLQLRRNLRSLAFRRACRRLLRLDMGNFFFCAKVILRSL